MPFQVIKAPKYSGPRHMCFNEEGDTIYVVGELNSNVLIFSIDKESRKIEY